MWSLLAIALAPGLAIIIYINWRDKSDREPFKHLFISFLLGILSAVIAVFIEKPLDSFGINYFGLRSASAMLFRAFVVAATVEELVKFAMVRRYAYPKKAFNEPLDGIVYGVMVAMGFATLENIFYVMDGGMSTGILRMFLAVPSHAAWGAIAGYFMGKAKFANNFKSFYLVFGLVIAILLHGLYDGMLFLRESTEFAGGEYDTLMIFGALGTAILGYVLAMLAVRKHRKISRKMFPLDKNAPIENAIATIDQR